MFSGALDKAKDLLSSGVDAAKDGVGALKEGVAAAADGVLDAVDPKKRLLKELKEKVEAEAGPITELQNQMKALAAPLEGLSSISSIGTKLQTDIVEKFNQIANGKKEEMGIPSGAMCVAGCWMSSIKEKMTRIAGDADTKIIGKLTGVGGTLQEPAPGGILDNLAEFKNKIQGATDGLAALVKLPESFKDIEFSPDGLNSFEATLNKAVETSQSALAGAMAALTETIKELTDNCGGFVDGFDTFISNAPKQVVKAFKPPVPCCCLSVAGEKIDDINLALDKGKAALDPLMKGMKDNVTNLQDVCSGITINPKMIDPFAERIKDALAQIKDMAAKLPGSDLRQCGSAEEAPAAGDVDPEA